jgi:hypothetical protein
MATSETSIGPGALRGGNEDPGNADGCGNKTLGEHGMPEPEVAGDAQGEGAGPPAAAGRRNTGKAADIPAPSVEKPRN